MITMIFDENLQDNQPDSYSCYKTAATYIEVRFSSNQVSSDIYLGNDNLSLSLNSVGPFSQISQLPWMSESSGLGNLTNWVRCASGNGFYVKRLQPKLLFHKAEVLWLLLFIKCISSITGLLILQRFIMRPLEFLGFFL